MEPYVEFSYDYPIAAPTRALKSLTCLSRVIAAAQTGTRSRSYTMRVVAVPKYCTASARGSDYAPMQLGIETWRERLSGREARKRKGAEKPPGF